MENKNMMEITTIFYKILDTIILIKLDIYICNYLLLACYIKNIAK